MSLKNNLIRKWQLLLLFLLVMLTIASPVAGQTEITLDHVGYQAFPGTVCPEAEIDFYIRFTNIGAGSVTGFTTGFKVYSPDGAKWPWISAEISGEPPWIFDFGPNIVPLGDTIGLGAATLGSVGMWDGFDEIVLKITVGPIPWDYLGLTVCLDSSWYPPGGTWLWSTTLAGGVAPGWGGPYCFEIYQCTCENYYRTSQNIGSPCPFCCIGVRGDVNGDGTDMDIVDLTCFVDYLFGTGCVIPCPTEADVNGNDEGPDIVDLTVIVDYLFGEAPPIVDCPPDTF